MKRTLLTTGLLLALSACGDADTPPLLTAEVQPHTFQVRIAAEGKLEAAVSTSITTPADVFEPMTLSWLAEDNADVKAGDVVARFDDLRYRREQTTETFKQQQVEYALDSKRYSLGNEKQDIRAELVLVASEFDFAKKFAVEDLRVFSRNEIIDKMANVEFLDSRRDYQNWRTGRHAEKARTEMELLNAQKKQSDTKLDNISKALERTEVRAPYDGVFVVETDWSGKRPRVGEQMWPGRKFASLPDMKTLQAQIQVLESESAGLATGLKVRLHLDADPDQIFEGVIKQVDALASAREQNNPVKYFSAVVQFDAPLPELARPGAAVRGDIIVAETAQALTVPLQAVIPQGADAFVWVLQDDQPEKRKVVLGTRSATRAVVTEGLQPGDRVLLQPLEAASE